MSDFLTMSDADFAAHGATKLAEAQAAPAVEAVVDTAVTEDRTNADAQAAAEALASESSVPADAGNAAAEIDQEGEAAQEGGGEAEVDALADTTGLHVEGEPELGADGKPVSKPEPTAAKDETSLTGLPEGTERIFESFRANGREMKVKSVDEAIRLMQMGANYSQKQAGAKKDRAFVKVLEQSGLNDHEKLAFAVDLLAGKPEAIGKLLKDSKIDVHDIDDDKVAAYRAESRAPSEATLDLDAVVAEIEGSKHFDRLVGELKTWDQKSQALVGSHPQSLKQLTEQMESGIYDKVMDEVNRQQVLGNLNGVPLMQAYNQVGQEMAAAGSFATAPAPKVPVKLLVTPGKTTSQATKADEERRRAAAPSKGVSTVAEVAKKPEFLSMSDAEFMKHSKSQ